MQRRGDNQQHSICAARGAKPRSSGCLALLSLALVAAASAPLTVARAEPHLHATTAAELDRLVAEAARRGAQVGVYVVRLSDGTPLYAHDADSLLVPASNVKLVTSAAALHYLTPDYVFPTEVFADLDAAGTARDLFIKGYGDPYLVPERLWYLANRLYYNGLRRVSGDIVVDDTYFDGPKQAAGAEQDLSSYSYMAPAGALSVGFNAIQVHVRPGQHANQDAEILIEPRSEYPILRGRVRTVDRGRTQIDVNVYPHEDRSVVQVSGHIAIGDGARGYWRRIDNPPIFAAEVLKAVLRSVSIEVTGGARTGLVPEGATRIGRIVSPRLAELVGHLNKHSNNFMAAQVAQVLGAEIFEAPGTWTKARHAISSFLEEKVGLPVGSYYLGNASGLHDINRLSAMQVVQVLQYIYQQPELRPEFMASLAVAGGVGTLQERMRETAANHQLRAKTGTLSSASALSGYVTAKSGDPLAFSFIVNDFRDGIRAVWDAQDAFGSTLAQLQFVGESAVLDTTSPPATAQRISSAATELR